MHFFISTRFVKLLSLLLLEALGYTSESFELRLWSDASAFNNLTFSITLHCVFVLQYFGSKSEDCLTALSSMAVNARTSSLPRCHLYAVDGEVCNQTPQHNSINCRRVLADNFSNTFDRHHQHLFTMPLLPSQGKVIAPSHSQLTNAMEIEDAQSEEKMNDCQIRSISDGVFEDEELIGDFSKPFCLPVVDSRHHDLKCISTCTVST